MSLEQGIVIISSYASLLIVQARIPAGVAEEQQRESQGDVEFDVMYLSFSGDVVCVDVARLRGFLYLHVGEAVSQTDIITYLYFCDEMEVAAVDVELRAASDENAEVMPSHVGVSYRDVDFADRKPRLCQIYVSSNQEVVRRRHHQKWLHVLCVVEIGPVAERQPEGEVFRAYFICHLIVGLIDVLREMAPVV